MARKLIKRIIPSHDWVRNHKSLRVLGDWLHEPNLWHLTRDSVSLAVFIGLFCAFIPLPGQMLIAGLAAIALRANLTLSVILVWVTNPLTMAPIFYIAYKVGTALMGVQTGNFHFELSWQWLAALLDRNWQPFLLGCLLCGLFFGLLGSATARLLWRWYTIKRWHERRLRRRGD